MNYLNQFLDKYPDARLRSTDRNDRKDARKVEDSSLESLTKLTETIPGVSVSFVSGSHQEYPIFSDQWPPRPTMLASWPVAWRLRWGELANELEDQGAPFPDHERQAFELVMAEIPELEVAEFDESNPRPEGSSLAPPFDPRAAGAESTAGVHAADPASN